MSANVVSAGRAPARAGAAEAALSWAAIPLGIALLLSRLWLANAGVAGAASLVVVFGALGALSLAAAPRPAAGAEEAPMLPTLLVLAVGAAAVAVAAAASTLPGPALSVPGGPIVLAVVACAGVAEEAFFRRLLYGRLLRWGAGVAVVVSAAAFGFLHVPLHGWAALPLDLGAGLFLSWQRWASGSWAAPAATHALANLVVVLR